MLHVFGYKIFIPNALDYTVNCLAGVSTLWFLGAIFGYKFDGRLKKCIVCVLGGIGGYIALLLTRILDIRLHSYIIEFLVALIFSLICLRGNILTKVVTCILVKELTLIAISVSNVVFSYITEISLADAYERVGYRYVIYRFFDIAFVFLFLLFVCILLKKSKILESKSNYLSIAILGIVSLMTLFLARSAENVNKNMFLFTLIGIIFINIAIQYFIIKKEKAEQARISIQQQYNFQKAHSDDVNELHQKLRHVKHDMKNHIQCLASMINTDKKDEAINYLEELSQEVSVNLSHTVVTESDVINCILDDKFETCRKLNIKYDYVVTGDNIKKVKDIDLSIILGNLLDNAIEACSKCDKKRIYLKISNEKAYLRIKVENTIEGSVLEKNPKLITNKLDGENHGLGVKSVESIANRYNGLIDFYEQDGMFIFNVMLSVYNR